jgi:hypothetical protein
MKKRVLLIAALLIAASVLPPCALTTEQRIPRRSKAYSELAAKAFDDGDYDASAAYAAEAERYADESAAFIERMIARSRGEAEMNRARTRLAGPKRRRPTEFPRAYARASEEVDAGGKAFDGEDYPPRRARLPRPRGPCLGARRRSAPGLLQVRPLGHVEGLPLEHRGESRGLRNPFLWGELYKANKRSLKRPSDPNLLMPGMVVEIPSLKGEYREGLTIHRLSTRALRVDE